MVQRLLDWHPEILAFPPETPLLEKYFRQNSSERERYFRKTFLEPEEGKQAQFVDDNYRLGHWAKMKRQFDIAPSDFMAVDSSAFQRAYDHALDGDGELFLRVLRGLLDGCCRSVSVVKEHYDNPRYFALKRPYYSELYARQVAQLDAASRFLHVVRSPLSQYASLKARRTSLGKSGPLNELDFVTSSCRTWVMSRQLAEQNLQALGDERYRIIYYEDLVDDPKRTMIRVAEWLGIPFDDCLGETTWFGYLVGANSSFKGLTPNSGRPSDTYRAVTSWSERTLMSYLLTHVREQLGRYRDEVPDTSRYRARLSWVLPMQGESLRHLKNRSRHRFNPTALDRDALRALLVDEDQSVSRNPDIQFF